MIAAAVKQWLYPALIAAGLTALGGYLHNDKDLTARVQALEAHQSDGAARLDRIENKVDKLLEWALGSKQ